MFVLGGIRFSEFGGRRRVAFGEVSLLGFEVS